MPEEIEEPIDPRTLPAEPVECSIGLWTHSEVDPAGNVYLIQQADGQTISIRANGDLSAENIEADIASPRAPYAPVPQEVTPAQFKAAARKQLGITEATVYALISQIEDSETQEDARDLYENALTFKRSDSFIALLAAMNGNDDADMDAVFTLAATLFR